MTSRNLTHRELIQFPIIRKEHRTNIFITAVFCFALGFVSGYYCKTVEAAGMDDCKHILYSRTKFIRHQIEPVRDACHSSSASCDAKVVKAYQETLASLPKLDHNLIMQCRKYQVYANN